MCWLFCSNQKIEIQLHLCEQPPTSNPEWVYWRGLTLHWKPVRGGGGGAKAFSASCPSVFIQGFWYFARSRTREIQVFPRNPAKFPKNTKYREIRQKYFQIYVGKTYLILILAIRPVLFTPNVQIYLESSSLQRVYNVPKLPGVLRKKKKKTGY